MACGLFAAGAGRQIQEAYAGTGQVRFEYKNLALIGEASVLAAEAALCASDQGQFWPYYDTVFANQGTLFAQGTDSRRGLKQIARMLGLDTTAFNRCFNDRQRYQDVQQSAADARAQGITSTPTVYVNGIEVENVQSFAAIQQLVAEELAKKGQ